MRLIVPLFGKEGPREIFSIKSPSIPFPKGERKYGYGIS
jgi:hypothetical protein